MLHSKLIFVLLASLLILSPCCPAQEMTPDEIRLRSLEYGFKGYRLGMTLKELQAVPAPRGCVFHIVTGLETTIAIDPWTHKPTASGPLAEEQRLAADRVLKENFMACTYEPSSAGADAVVTFATKPARIGFQLVKDDGLFKLESIGLILPEQDLEMVRDAMKVKYGEPSRQVGGDGSTEWGFLRPPLNRKNQIGRNIEIRRIRQDGQHYTHVTFTDLDLERKLNDLVEAAVGAIQDREKGKQLQRAKDAAKDL